MYGLIEDQSYFICQNTNLIQLETKRIVPSGTMHAGRI